jgi:hypothetical protein
LEHPQQPLAEHEFLVAARRAAHPAEIHQETVQRTAALRRLDQVSQLERIAVLPAAVHFETEVLGFGARGHDQVHGTAGC